MKQNYVAIFTPKNKNENRKILHKPVIYEAHV